MFGFPNVLDYVTYHVATLRTFIFHFYVFGEDCAKAQIWVFIEIKLRSLKLTTEAFSLVFFGCKRVLKKTTKVEAR